MMYIHAMKRMQLILTNQLYEALVMAKKVTGLRMSDIMRRALEMWLAQHMKL